MPDLTASASASEPSFLQRRIVSAAQRRFGNLARQHAARQRHRQRRHGQRRLRFFYQVNDPYSVLVTQLMPALLRDYDLHLKPYLVPAAAGPNTPEPERLARLAGVDAGLLAPAYGLAAPAALAPAPGRVALAQRVLAGALDSPEFADLALATGEALFGGADLASLLGEDEPASSVATAAALNAGVRRRHALGHYASAMLHYEGEWYWGVDRLHHLEARLREEGAVRSPASAMLAPRPPIITGPHRDVSDRLTLECYPSLRSPYSALIFDQARRLCQATGVRLLTRPVLPMVMRGVPVTPAKGRYIFFDAAREARALGLAWGRIVDPIGQPVRHGYALWHWARERGSGDALFAAFLRAAFVEGVDLSRTAGLRHVVAAAGLSWGDARKQLHNDHWQAELEDNRLALYQQNCWGVPSFRLLDRDAPATPLLWGQDRLWWFAREIQRRLGGGH